MRAARQHKLSGAQGESSASAQTKGDGSDKQRQQMQRHLRSAIESQPVQGTVFNAEHSILLLLEITGRELSVPTDWGRND